MPLATIPNVNRKVLFTKKGQKFKRLGSCSVICEGCSVKPTQAKQTYKRNGELQGFYAGDPKEWYPILLRDGYLKKNENICVGTFIFPKGTPYMEGFQKDGNFDIVEEQFIVYNKPIVPSKVKEFNIEEFWDEY